jgi:uncharacterized protein YbjT (DUF2867 family)
VLPSLHQPLDAPVRTISTADIGQQVAENLLQAGAGEKIVYLEGPARYSPADVAATFARLLNRPVTPVAPPREAWVAALTAGGLGHDYARLLAEMYEGFNCGRIGVEAGVGESRRGQTTLEQALGRLVVSRV